jgi:hypothetical protein
MERLFMKKNCCFLFCFILILLCSNLAEAYDYPFVNAYEATVLATPSLYEASLPKEGKLENLEMTVFQDREIPKAFWYQNKFRFGLVRQKKKAPLIFIISGTGGSYYTGKMRYLQKVFYNAGFHIIALSSPTHPNFIVTASSTGVPGHIVYDVQDLHRVMELAWEKVKKKVTVTGFYLTGYSLGAAQSAFLAKLDEERRLFNFKKVLMINPPVSLYNSVQILDAMLVENIPGGLDRFDEFFDRLMARLSDVYDTMGYIDFSDDYLYEVYKKYPPKDQGLAAVIGASFRMSSADMVCTSDVMTHAGLVIPKNRVLTPNDPMTDFVKVYMRTSFSDYFNDLFYPFFESLRPGLIKESLIQSVSLESIAEYLKRTDKIGLMHNEDDLILAPGEIDFFKMVFGDRAKIYPVGGHCGNMDHRDNVKYMIDFFQK